MNETNETVEVPPEFVEFLLESDRIEGLSPIDYRQAAHSQRERGHVGVLVHALLWASERRPITDTELIRWQVMLREERGLGPVTTASRDDITRVLNKATSRAKACSFEPSDIVAVLADTLFDCERSNLFSAETGRISRVFLAYLATLLERPILVFRSNDAKAYRDALQNLWLLRLYIGRKFRESVSGMPGTRYLRVSGDQATSRYRSEQGDELLVDWHELLSAEMAWHTSASSP